MLKNLLCENACMPLFILQGTVHLTRDGTTASQGILARMMNSSYITTNSEWESLPRFKHQITLLQNLRYENWTIKKAEDLKTDAFNVVLKKTLESPLDSKEIKPVNPKGNQP